LKKKGFEQLIPMAEFRDWLKLFCYEKANRMAERRNGQAGLGPLTFEARNTVLERLTMLQAQVGKPLISLAEIELIHNIWAQDQSTHLFRRTDRLLGLLSDG
jgi:DNA sulfur modification protein DndC